MKLLFTIMVTLALLHGAAFAVGAPSESDGCTEPCAGDSPEQCPRDAPDGQCPPLCNHCVCCISISPFVDPVFTVYLGIEVRRSPVFDTTDRPDFTFTNDISHVPKFLLG